MATKTLYKIQIGAYKYKENAEKIADKLKKRKFPAMCVLVDGLWKVQSGAFSIKNNAELRVEDLKRAGFNAVIVVVPGSEESSATVTGFSKVLAVMKTIMSAKNPHQKVIDILDKHGHTLKWSSAWCSETVVAAFLEAGYGYLIGGWAADAPTLKAHGKKLGIWHDGGSGVKAGDIVLYGSDKPNHTEFAIDGTYNISGNYNGTVAKRKRSGRKIHGYLRPAYPVVRSGSDDKEGDSTTVPPSVKVEHPRIRVWAIKFWESNPETYGDATVIIQYGADGKTIEHVVLVDTGMNGTDTIKKLKKAGVTFIDAIVISHDHSDHYGYLEEILKQFKVGHVYFPNQDGVKKYKADYASRISKQAAKCTSAKVPYSYVKVGGGFTVGKITFKAIFQADASKLKEKEGHHFINNMSLVYHAVIDGTWIFDFGGDLQDDGIEQLMAALSDEELRCDGFKIRWHGDRGAIRKALAKALKALVAFCNYHHSRSSGGRNSTYKVFEDVGTLVVENHKDGEIYMDICGKEMTVSGSKTGVLKTFKK